MRLEKEDAVPAAPFGNQLDWPRGINHIRRLLRSQIRASIQHPFHTWCRQPGCGRGIVLDTCGMARALPLSVF